ncbi:MAG TPA: transposase [Terriglobales bacterium]|jgi:REP element-mobilizing transposase RayT|nr:transposase [Terriglobales bacterium]
MDFPDRTFFVTTVTSRRTRHFQTDHAANLFVATLFHYRDQGAFSLYEFVVMPDHVHLLLAPRATMSLENVMQYIKGGYSFRHGKATGSRAEIWERSFTNHHVRDWQDLENHKRYIRLNPIRAGFCLEAEEFQYSSAHPGYVLDQLELRLKPAI